MYAAALTSRAMSTLRFASCHQMCTSSQMSTSVCLRLYLPSLLSLTDSTGGYSTTLTYVQPDVQTKTGKSLHLLLPILAQPIVQKIVSGSVLGIETVIIKDIKENSFVTSLKGSITDAGPCSSHVAWLVYAHC